MLSIPPRKQAPTARRRSILTKAGGWLVAGFGAVHTVVAPFDVRDTWSRVAAEKWWNTFTLDRPSTVDEFQRSEAFWVTAGSFGVPLLALGAYILWSARHGGRVPAWLGWGLLIYGVAVGVVLPLSPIWAIVLAGLLIILGDRAQRSPNVTESHPAGAATAAPESMRE